MPWELARSGHDCSAYGSTSRALGTRPPPDSRKIPLLSGHRRQPEPPAPSRRPARPNSPRARAPYKNSDTGAAYVFVRSRTAWSQPAGLTAASSGHDPDLLKGRTLPVTHLSASADEQ
jgi:hypothetical protein